MGMFTDRIAKLAQFFFIKKSKKIKGRNKDN